MKKNLNSDPAKIELTPLNPFELEVVLTLLRTKLQKKNYSPRMAGARTIMQAIQAGRFGTRFSIELDHGRKKKNSLMLAVNPYELLVKSQAKWRSAVHGPNIQLEVKENPDFDTLKMKDPVGYRIPEFVFEAKPVHRSRTKVIPGLQIRVRSVNDIFDWLLVRAVANRQLSRFAHCVVCNEWVLKKLAGQRSRRIYKFVLENPDTAKWPRDAPAWYFPIWPALCDKNKCKTRYNSVFTDSKRGKPRAKFERDEFHGTTT